MCNGSTTDSDSVCGGSNPSSPANMCDQKRYRTENPRFSRVFFVFRRFSSTCKASAAFLKNRKIIKIKRYHLGKTGDWRDLNYRPPLFQRFLYLNAISNCKRIVSDKNNIISISRGEFYRFFSVKLALLYFPHMKGGSAIAFYQKRRCASCCFTNQMWSKFSERSLRRTRKDMCCCIRRIFNIEIYQNSQGEHSLLYEHAYEYLCQLYAKCRTAHFLC